MNKNLLDQLKDQAKITGLIDDLKNVLYIARFYVDYSRTFCLDVMMSYNDLCVDIYVVLIIFFSNFYKFIEVYVS